MCCNTGHFLCNQGSSYVFIIFVFITTHRNVYLDMSCFRLLQTKRQKLDLVFTAEQQ